jgi:hypothetical protein
MRNCERHSPGTPESSSHSTRTSYPSPQASDRRGRGSKASVNYELALLRHGFKVLRVPNAPVFSLPDPQNARQNAPSDEDIEALIAAMPEGSFRALTLAAAVTGWRTHSELIPLTWDRVLDGRFALEAGKTKSGKPRTFPYAAHTELRRAIDAQRERQKAAGT